MDLSIPQIINAEVMHKRISPKINKFNYQIYYLVLPLKIIEDQTINQLLKLNKFGFISFDTKDHGFKDKRDLRAWAEAIHETYGIACPKNITLVCMPKILGYGFNPVSFWLCYNDQEEILSVIYEVNNTFGENHSYICYSNGENLNNHQWLTAKKHFHVSPFFKVSGFYKFKISICSKFSVRINYFQGKQLRLCTKLVGSPIMLDKKNLYKIAIKQPLLSFKVITLIHFQALKLVYKKATYHSKPDKTNKNSTTNT